MTGAGADPLPAALHDLLERSRDLGFLGPGPVAAHIEHALGYAQAAPAAPTRFADLGTGGGVPGLVLAVRWATSEALLVESQERRAQFLAEAVSQLGVGDRVTVAAARAEEVARQPRWRHSCDLVVARSFGRPAVTAESAAPLLRLGGALLVSEPPDDDPGRWPPAGLAELGLEDLGVWTGSSRYRRLRAARTCDARFPRRVGVPAKRPLF